MLSLRDLEDFSHWDDSLITEELKAAALGYLKQKDTDFYNLIKDMRHDCF